MSEQRVTTDELIVLLDAEGRAAGTAPKAPSHHESTPLHLAFSCYLTDDAGRVLITQRAHGKASFPSVWTNSCCGHPAPGESLREAVSRRVATELGLRTEALTLVLPEFRYRATAANGLVENELCPVVRAAAAGELRPHPEEVATAEWRDWDACVKLADHPSASPWFRSQMERLVPLGAPATWPAASPELLPPAITW
ncbi:isopentenyl-diphosphate Delta-isomerase [Actinoallomurus iriomotensis]|uniref:Isopentenyl-diphosphate Delta-isomerase n=1 Tax=Actinoallomurus iriomotensis TaxID=478107 RepID=A0A9W6RQ94_9ACTN|nr:isopentenyl-diphosphate Delta-isomerase [Actinoallomurus iriomotensis]GLY78192.1 isopentenyl-diphosphate Delta-isomerase [Actinoallomurus iriomotensis]